MKSRDNIKESLFKNNELTRGAFISNMKDYLNQLLNKPSLATPNDVLRSFGINGPKALEIVLDKNKPHGPLVTRTEKIKTGNNGRDKFYVKYTLLNNENNFYDKMKTLYAKYIENNKLTENLLKEDSEGGFYGGAASASNCNDTAPITPMSKPIKRKTVYITQEQLNYLKEAIEMDTMHGDFGYDAPGLSIPKNDPVFNHKNMIKKSRKVNESFGSDFKTITGDVFWSLNQIIDEKTIDDLSERGIIPEELSGDFGIQITIKYETGFDPNSGPWSEELDRYISGGEYDEAVSFINQIKNNKLKNVALNSLEDVLYVDGNDLMNVEDF